MSVRVVPLRPSSAGTGGAPDADPSHPRPLETPRGRLLAAAEDLIGANGAEQLRVIDVTAAARVSRTTFYAIFADREDCLLAVFDEVCERVGTAMLGAYAAESSWLSGVRAALGELLVFLDGRSNLARFLVLGGVSGDSPLVVRRRRALSDLARALETDSPDATVDGAVPFGSQALVNGAASIIHSRLLEDPVPALVDLSGSLMALLVLPFVGEGVARGELARAAAHTPPRSGVTRRGQSSMSAARVSRRTARVLAVIAGSPGISNRRLAQQAGDVDEGQISKLLTRLSRLGVIANDGAGPGRRSTNSWRLTDAGSELLATLAAGKERRDTPSA